MDILYHKKSFCAILYLMTKETAVRLKGLAEKYEAASFLNDDPSQFLRWYADARDAEVAAFIAAMLSFGSRSQFIPKIKSIFSLADKAGGMASWLLGDAYTSDFCVLADSCGCEGDYEKKFYRFYSYNDMVALFSRLSEILKASPSFGDYIHARWSEMCNEQCKKEGTAEGACSDLGAAVSSAFPGCKIVPHGKDSANKRVYMFLRWMVRVDSPVDVGLWRWYSPADLTIPLDTHVIQESVKLGLIEKNASASLKTAKAITQELKEIWPHDPCKGDFALFGLGVDGR